MTQFKKISFTLTNVGWGKIHLPEEQMRTSAYWLPLPPDISGRMREAELQGAVRGLSNALQNIAPCFLMCARETSGSIRRFDRPLPIVRPYLFMTGSRRLGFGPRLYDLHDE